MQGLTTLWRRFGGLAAGLFLVVLTLMPALDAFMCANEGPQAVRAAYTTVVDEAHHDDGAAQHSDASGHCLHGHCHHATPYMPAVFEVAAVTPAPAAAPEAAADAAPAADPRFGLKRPPRA